MSTSLSIVSLLLVAKHTLSHVMMHIVSRVALAISDKVRSISVGVSSDVLIMSMKLRGDWSRYVAQLAEVSVMSRYGRSGSLVTLGLRDITFYDLPCSCIVADVCMQLQTRVQCGLIRTSTTTTDIGTLHLRQSRVCI